MAEDKRIRISTDASGVQALRQNIAQFYTDIEGKSRSWRQMAESDIDAIYQKWEKLIQLRNSVQSSGSIPNWRFDQMVPEFSQADTRLTQLQQDRLSFLNQSRVSSGDVGGGGGLVGWLRRISMALERKNRNEEHSIAGGRRFGTQPGGQSGESGRGLNWSGAAQQMAGGNFSGALGALLGVGALAASVSKLWGMVQQGFERTTAVYNANSGVERSLEVNRFWDFLPWTKSANDRAQAALQSYQGNLRTQYMLGSAYGISSDRAFVQQLQGSRMGHYNLSEGEGQRIAIEAAKGAGIGMAGGAAAGFAAGSIVPGLGNLAGAVIGAVIGAVGGGAVGGGSQAHQESLRNEGSYELHNIFSQYLGKNMTEAGQDVYNLKRAGVRSNKTGFDDIFNAMVGQKIYNLDMGSLTGAAGVTRFGTESRGVGSIASAFEKSLKRIVTDPNELGVRLQESLGLYTKMAQGVLGTRGSFNQSDVIGTINALQGLGFEGQQLERLSSGLMGVNGGGQGTFAKALRLQAASQMGASDMLSLQAALEAPSEGMQKKLMSNLWKVSGGDKAQFGTLLMSTLGLKAKDVQDLLGKKGVFKNGQLDINALFEGGSEGGYFSLDRAKQLTTDLERSMAGTENRKIAEGGAHAMSSQIIDDISAIKNAVDSIVSTTLKVKIMGLSDEAKRGMQTTIKVK